MCVCLVLDTYLLPNYPYDLYFKNTSLKINFKIFMDGPFVIILTIWIGQLRFFQYYIKIISRYLKMFPYGDISFIVSVDQINHMAS
jgi:uncharacterized membrane protein YkgB